MERPFESAGHSLYGLIGVDGALTGSLATEESARLVGWSPDGTQALFYLPRFEAGGPFAPYTLLAYELASGSSTSLGEGSFYCGYEVADWSD